MLRTPAVWANLLFVFFAATPAWAQQDPLQGRWEGMVRSIQGERKATLTFRKEGDTYTGSLSGITGTTELPFKEIKLNGDKVKATMQVDAPQGSVTVNFDFALKGDALEGNGEVYLGTQRITFSYDMKRLGELVAKVEITPEQKMGYFVGQWNFEMVGRESPLGPGGTMTGTVTFAPVLNGKFLESRLEARAGDVVLKGGGFLGYDPGNKVYTFFQHQNNGIAMFGTGTWVGPGIRMETVPVKVKEQAIRLRRQITIVRDGSFTLKEEFSVNGGPFQRLASGTFSKVE